MIVRHYLVRNEGETARRFVIRLEEAEGRWTSSCEEVDSTGKVIPGSARIAPKFYGLTEEQAARRMLAALENSFDDVVETGL